MSMYDQRSRRHAIALAGAVVLLIVTADFASAQRLIRADSLRQIQTVVPLHGPPGTTVEIASENLPLAARIHLAVGAIHSGFETLGEGSQGEWGDVSGSIRIPESAPWDRPLYVIALNGVFSPIGLSDPFHVTNADGMVRREGRITEEAESCLTLRDEDDLLYALTGDLGAFRAGDEVIVEGVYSETSACMDGSTIGVVRIVPCGSPGVPQAAAQQSGMKDMRTFPRPIEALDNVWIEELTMLEVRDALAEGTTTALILTGGIEENGPYLTTGKHNHVLRVMGESIARRLGNALVAPIVTIEPGNPERASSPGGIRLSQETFQAVLRDMATSLKAQGFTDIFLMGDSGGNRRGMAAVAEGLTETWAGEGVVIGHIPEYYNYDDVVEYQKDVLGIDEDPRLEGLHDDYYITSIIMNDDPEYVRLEQRIAADKASINGISLLPVEETLEHGQRLIEFRTDATVEAIRAMRAAGGR